MLFSGFCLGIITVLFIVIARDFHRLFIAKVFLALLVAVAAFLLRNVVPANWSWLMGDLMTFIPALFWLLCQVGFARRPSLRSIWSLLALYSCVIPALARPFGAPMAESGWLHVLAWELPRSCEYLVILNGLWVVIAHWQDDLIESRRRLRMLMLCTLGLTSLWVTLSMNTGYLPAFSLNVVASVAALVTGFALLKGRDGIFARVRHLDTTNCISIPQQAEPSPPSEQEVLLEKLHALMTQGYYRTEKLTLSMLARELSIPEYKTRALINEAFDYRNFNDYINHLRIGEASERLLAEPQTPIQNIALDVGYRTLSSFNRAFREIRGCTPSEYRQHTRSDSFDALSRHAFEQGGQSDKLSPVTSL